MSQTNGSAPHNLTESLAEKRTRLELLQVENQLRRAELVQTRQQKLKESYESWDWIGSYSDLIDRMRGPDRDLLLPVSTANDRRYGANWPFWRSEVEHSRLRAAARLICQTSPLAQGIIEGLTSYVVGQGFGVKAVWRDSDDGKPDRAVLKAAQRVLDDLVDVNDFADLQQELFSRERRDGEYFLRSFPRDDGWTAFRVVEPEQVLMPPTRTLDEASFGIITDPDDIRSVLAYSVAYDGNSANAEEVEAVLIAHAKCNVDSTVKRGQPDFAFETLDLIKTATRLLENLGQGAAIQAAIALVRQHALADGAAVADFVSGMSDYQQQVPFTGQSRNVQRWEAGTILDMDSGQQYVDPPMAKGASSYVEVVQALLRAIAVKWSAPEWLVSGNDSGSSYASGLVSESPFVRRCQRLQKKHANLWRRVCRRAVEHYCQVKGGLRIGTDRIDFEQLWALVDIHVTPPALEVRNKGEEASVNQTYISLGVKSRQTVAQEQGLRWDVEEANNLEFEQKHGEQGISQGDRDDGSAEMAVKDPSRVSGGDDEEQGGKTDLAAMMKQMMGGKGGDKPDGDHPEPASPKSPPQPPHPLREGVESGDRVSDGEAALLALYGSQAAHLADEGERMLRLIEGAWDEKKHPRDHGKFAHKPGDAPPSSAVPDVPRSPGVDEDWPTTDLPLSDYADPDLSNVYAANDPRTVDRKTFRAMQQDLRDDEGSDYDIVVNPDNGRFEVWSVEDAEFEFGEDYLTHWNHRTGRWETVGGDDLQQEEDALSTAEEEYEQEIQPDEETMEVYERLTGEDAPITLDVLREEADEFNDAQQAEGYGHRIVVSDDGTVLLAWAGDSDDPDDSPEHWQPLEYDPKAWAWLTPQARKARDVDDRRRKFYTESVARKKKPLRDDPKRKAEMIARVLFGLFGRDALQLFTIASNEDAGHGPADVPESYRRLLEAWNPLDHPRDPRTGRFIPRGSAAAVHAAKTAVGKVLKDPVGSDPASAQSVAEHLAILTVKQIKALAKEHGFAKVPDAYRHELVAAVLRRLDPQTVGEDGKPIEPPSPEPAKEEPKAETPPEPEPQATAPEATANAGAAPPPPQPPLTTKEPTTDERPDDGRPDADVDGGRTGGAGDGGSGRVRIARADLTRAADPAVLADGLRRHLTDHQQQGAAAAVTAMSTGPGGFLLADGTGVGKTRQQLAVAAHFAAQGKKVLIVSPAEVLKPDWPKGKVSGSFAADAADMGIDVRLQRDGALQPGKVALTTYNQLKEMAAQVDGNTVVVFDEAHSLKNWESQRAKLGGDMQKAAHAVLYATATPADHPLDLGYLYRAGVYGGMRRHEFLTSLGLREKKVYNAYLGREITTWETDPRVGKAEVFRRVGEVFDRLTRSGRMLKREIDMSGVPISFAKVAMPPQAHEELERIRRGFPSAQRAQALLAQRLHQEAYKIPAAVDLVKQALAEGRRPVVFVARVSDGQVTSPSGEVLAESGGTARLLKEALSAEGVTDVAELHGGAVQAKKGMAAFQSGGSRVAIATVESGGTGVNLDDTDGDKPRTLIVLTPQFSAMSNMQVYGRVWRLKTKSVPKVVNVFGDTAIDDWNASLIAGKMKGLGAVVGGVASAVEFPELADLSPDAALEVAADPAEYRRQREAPPPKPAPASAPAAASRSAVAPASVPDVKAWAARNRLIPNKYDTWANGKKIPAGTGFVRNEGGRWIGYTVDDVRRLMNRG